jgi:hypothetical protein
MPKVYHHFSDFSDKLLEEFDKKQYEKYIRKAKKTNQRSTKSNDKRVRAEFSLPFPIENFTPEMQAAAINAIAAKLNIPPSEIKVIEVNPGSTKLILEIPSSALDEIISIIEADRPKALSNLGISYVTEILSETYNLQNLINLFAKGFKLKQLIDFCTKNFDGVLEQIPQPIKIDILARKLVEYAIQNDQMPTLLALARKDNRIAYNKYLPYYNIPRKLFERTRLEKEGSELLQKRLKSALAKGIWVSALGSAFTFLLVVGIALVTGSYDLASFAWLLLVVVANFVRRIVIVNLGEELIGEYRRVSTNAFILGFMLAPFLVMLIILIIFFTIKIIASGVVPALGWSLSFILNMPYPTSLLIRIFMEEMLFRPLLFLGFLFGCYSVYRNNK